jgi:fused signal recognition particle receptor
LAVADASVLPDGVKVAIHWLHRVGALLVFLLLSALMLRATSEENPKPMRRAGIALSALQLAQIGLGIYAVKHDLPFAAVELYHVLAAVLMTPLLAVYFYCRYAPQALEIEPESASAPVETLRVARSAASVSEPVAEPSILGRLKGQLTKTRGSLQAVLASLQFSANRSIREQLDDVEASLIMADVGMETTSQIIERLQATLEKDELQDSSRLSEALKGQLYGMLEPCSQPLRIPEGHQGPFVILVVGVNGAGKTTSIGKLAHRLQSQGLSVMLAAGDTFRAAAVEQLQAWGERNGVPVVAQASGSDSASVIYDALQSAIAKKVDVLIADTAGRLHTKSNLMDELKKIKRIMGKLDVSAPHEVLLILDAGTGQNALSQARLFHEAVGLTGLALTKMDGTAKGGVIFALANQLQIPIRFIGVGESMADLQDFDAKNFVDALFAGD